MATLRVHFLPDTPSLYIIRWKRSTDNKFPDANLRIVTKTSDAEQTSDITIPDTLTDWDIMINSKCGDQIGGGRSYRVRGTCQAVTFDVSHCICSTVDDMSMQTT